MTYFYLRATAFVTGCFLILITFLYLLPKYDNDLEQFRLDMLACGQACLLNIYVNKTTVRGAIEILEAHPWVTNIQVRAAGNGFASMGWDWSGQQSAWVDTSREGRITFYWDEEDPNTPDPYNQKVETIAIYTHLQIQGLQKWYGLASAGKITLRHDQRVGYDVAYNSHGYTMIFSTEIACPANIFNFLTSTTQIRISIGSIITQYVPYSELRKTC